MHSTTPAELRPGTMAIAVLGADMMLAALPATPVQVAHACLASDYQVAVPASWGDELLAMECLKQLADRGPRPAVMCTCPYVRSELLAVGPDLAPVLVSLVPPPVAVARYLHALYGRDRIHVTYIGSCPGAVHEDIDVAVSPGEFLATLEAAGIALTEQPQVFDSVIPPDRRRFFSVAGGVPSAEQLWSIGNGRSLVELDGEDYLIDLAQHLLSHESALIDLAPRLGCACSGASSTIPARSARAAVAVVEPPRAASAVIDVAIAVDVTSPIDVSTDGSQVSSTEIALADDARMHETHAPAKPASAPAAPRHATSGSRRATASVVHSLQNAPPMARVAGRALPRAYVAMRRIDPHAEAPADERPVGRIPAPTVDPVREDLGRSRQPARVAAPARSNEDRAAASSLAPGAAGAPEKMSDGPRG